MDNRKFYWLKLKDDFFRQKEIKKLRKIAGGDTYTVIYLKMMLLSLVNDCKVYFEGIEDSFIEELALDLDEDVDNVKVTVMFLIKNGLLEEATPNEYILNYAQECTGSETVVASRVRRYREKQKALQCNTDVTKCNVEIEKEIEKREKREDKEIDNRAKSQRFVPPTVDEVQKYCSERNNQVDAERFVDFYESKGWMVGKNKMKNWKAAVRNWEQRDGKKKDGRTKFNFSTDTSKFEDISAEELGLE